MSVLGCQAVLEVAGAFLPWFRARNLAGGEVEAAGTNSRDKKD